MDYAMLPGDLPQLSGRSAPARSGRIARVLVMTAGFAVLAGVVPGFGNVARAGDDEPKISLPPGVRRSSNQLVPHHASIRIATNLVQIPVLVTDPYQRPVQGLTKSDFRLFEGGVEQEIKQFSIEETPISIGIVFDASGSMLRKMDTSRQAIVELLKMSMPGDEFFLLKFADRPESVCGFTTETRDIEDALPSLQAKGWTSLFDAIYLGVNKMKHASHARKVLLVLSDGEDNKSRYAERELISFVQEADVRIFSISILDRSRSLEAIAAESGGRALRVHKLGELPKLAVDISEELHSQYVLGFTPTELPMDGKYRRVKVELAPQAAGNARLHTSWKRGFYEPEE